MLIADADADMNVFASGSGAAPIGPAGSETVTIEVLESDVPNLRFSVSTMLVNTNDGISGVNGVDVSGLAEGDVWSGDGIVYDAGTEANTAASVLTGQHRFDNPAVRVRIERTD